MIKLKEVYLVVTNQGYIMRAYLARKLADDWCDKCNISAANRGLKAQYSVVRAQIHNRPYTKRSK